MEINTQNLLNQERNVILSHIMLEDTKKAEEIAKTLEGKVGNNRIVDVKLLFNGVEVDGKVIEDWLQYQLKEYQKKFEDRYSDVEAEIQKRVDKIKKNVEYEYRSETIDKIQKLRELLDKVELDLECLDF